MPNIIFEEQCQQQNMFVPNAIRIGTGKIPLVMLHGWGQSLESIRPLGELLGHFAEVHLLDLPGFGLTPKPELDWGSKQYAEFVLKYLDDNNLRQVDLLGHSFGGKVAIYLTSMFQHRVRSLILINSAGLQRKQSLKTRIRSAYIRFIGKITKQLDWLIRTSLYEKWFVPQFGSRDYKNAGAMRNILVKVVNENGTSAASKITIPTYILWGEKDNETPVEMGERLHKLIPNSTLIVLPGKDHFPFFGVGAHLCAHYILQFLQSFDENKRLKEGK